MVVLVSNGALANGKVVNLSTGEVRGPIEPLQWRTTRLEPCEGTGFGSDPAAASVTRGCVPLMGTLILLLVSSIAVRCVAATGITATR